MTNVLLWHWGRRGGGPKYTLDLARSLSAEVDCTLHLSLSRQAEIYGDLVGLGLPVHAIDTYYNRRTALMATLRLSSLRRRFSQILIDNEIGSVISTMSHLWSPFMVDRVRDAGAKLITVVHDAVAHPGDEYPFRRLMMMLELGYTDHVVTLTQAVADQLMRQHRIPAHRISVIPHGVFQFGTAPIRVRTAPHDRPLRFLFFGRLLPYKGLDLLLDAIDCLPPDLPFTVHVAGSGDPGLLLPRLMGSNRITLDHRWIPESEIAQILDRADVVVAPYREASQSGVLAAAYGAGLPMIVTPIGGLPEQVAPYGAGLVCADLTPAAFAAAMTRMVREPDLYAAAAAASVRTAQGPFAWSTIARQFADLVHRV